MVTTDYPPDIGGIAAHVHNLSRQLIKRGHEVTVAFLRRQSSADSALVSDGIKVHAVRSHLKLGPLQLRARRLLARRCVARLANEKRFDVVHIHGHTYEAYATKVLPRSTPVVGTVHSSGFLEKASSKRGRHRLAGLLSHLRAVTAPSREICDVTNSLALRAGTCEYVPNGVDVEKYKPGIDGSMLVGELNLKADRKIILCARRIVPKNGVLYFAQAVNEIVRNHPDALAVFAGSEDAQYAQTVREALTAGGADGASVFLGTVPNDRMPELMALAAVSVLPSLVEATSITGLESMASGLPVVGTTVGGIPELIDDGVHGLLVSPRDPDALAQAICRVLSDGKLAEHLGAAARDRAVEEFNWDRISSRMEDVYDRAIAKKEECGA